MMEKRMVKGFIELIRKRNEQKLLVPTVMGEEAEQLIKYIESLEAQLTQAQEAIRVKDEALEHLLQFIEGDVSTGWQSHEDCVAEARQALTADGKDD